MRALEPWVVHRCETFLAESAARLTLLMTSSGQVVAQHGFSRSLDVMTAAALGAAIVASTEELARLMGASRFGAVVHHGQRQSCMLVRVRHAARTLDRAGGVRAGDVGGTGPALLRSDGGGAGGAAPREHDRSRRCWRRISRHELNASLKALFGR